MGRRAIQQLWIAHELGLEQEYCMLWEDMVWQSGVDEAGNLVMDGSKVASDAAGGHGSQAKAMKGMIGE
jgi:hypothetical protein